MNAAQDLQHEDRGAALLLEHCAALADAGETRATAADRLDGVLGRELARFLVSALAGRGRRASV